MKGKMINKELSKEERITAEERKLKGLLTKLDAKTKRAAHSLIENAAFMAITLEDLQRLINKNGVVSTYKNGENQYGTKKSPEVETYNSMIKNHMTVMKQLTDLLPKELPKKDEDEFDEFVNDK